MTKPKPRATDIDPKHEHWNTQCPDCEGWFRGQKGLGHHKAVGCIVNHKTRAMEGLEDWAKEFIVIRVKHRGKAFGDLKATIEEIDFIRNLLSRREEEVREEAKEEVYKNIGGWYNLPEYKDFNGGCSVCGGKSVEIRGGCPHTPKRTICPTCTREVLEDILDSCNNRLGSAAAEKVKGEK